MSKSNENGKSRREFLKTAGKLAIYTPPALTLLLHQETASAGWKKIHKSPGQKCVQKYRRTSSRRIRWGRIRQFRRSRRS